MLELTVEWDGFEEAFAELEHEVTDIVRGMTVFTWNGILTKTPQFAGGMAASWSYSLNAPQFYDRSDEIDPETIGARELATGQWRSVNPVRRGHPAAIDIANRANAGADRAFKLGDTVWLANGVDHGQGPYAAKVESGEVKLRSVNQPGAPVKRTLHQIEARFGRDVNNTSAATLKALKLGGFHADSDS